MAIIFSQALNINSPDWKGWSGRSKIPASALSFNANRISIRLEASSLEGFKIQQCYVGHAGGSGNAWDFDGGQVQVLFSGNSYCSIPAGSIIESDILNFNLDNTRALIIAFDATNTDPDNDSLRVVDYLSGFNAYYKQTDGNLESGQTAPGGYTPSDNNRFYLVNRISSSSLRVSELVVQVECTEGDAKEAVSQLTGQVEYAQEAEQVISQLIAQIEYDEEKESEVSNLIAQVEYDEEGKLEVSSLIAQIEYNELGSNDELPDPGDGSGGEGQSVGAYPGLCELYEINLAVGLNLYLTSLDVNVDYDGKTFQAIPITRGQIRFNADLQVDALDVTFGVIGVKIGTNEYTIPQVVKAEFLKNAHLKLYLYDRIKQVLIQIKFEGWASAGIKYDSGTITISFGCILDRLKATVPRLIYTEECNHTLFDDFCGLVKEEGWQESGSVGAGSSNVEIHSSIFVYSEEHPAGYWEKGSIAMTSGNCNLIKKGIEYHGDGYVRLLLPFPFDIQETDTFNALPGCDKSGKTCDEKFSNYDNFLGFEYIPTPEEMFNLQ